MKHRETPVYIVLRNASATHRAARTSLPVHGACRLIPRGIYSDVCSSNLDEKSEHVRLVKLLQFLEENTTFCIQCQFGVVDLFTNCLGVSSFKQLSFNSSSVLCMANFQGRHDTDCIKGQSKYSRAGLWRQCPDLLHVAQGQAQE